MKKKIVFDPLSYINITGASVHNLKNISLSIPRNQLVLFTGLSGSGKSSLAFNTIYAEGQRRYLESFSNYARQYLPQLEKPDVEQITGLSPVIAIEQKTISNNPKSTVGTISEIYDYLRLLFARLAEPISPISGQKMEKMSFDQISKLIFLQFANRNINILAPVVKGRKGSYRELFNRYLKFGFSNAFVDGEFHELKHGMMVDRYKEHNIAISIDKLDIKKSNRSRLTTAMNIAMGYGNGSLMLVDSRTEEIHHYSSKFICPSSGISYDEPAPNAFSFNTPYGYCIKCKGVGGLHMPSVKKIVPDISKSINDGALLAINNGRESWALKQIERLSAIHKFSMNTPWEKLNSKYQHMILFGFDKMDGSKQENSSTYEGIGPMLNEHFYKSNSKALRKWAGNFMEFGQCTSCKGSRLNNKSLQFKIGNRNIAELAKMEIASLHSWLEGLQSSITGQNKLITKELFKETLKKTSQIIDIGLGYLALNRSSKSLSGGEAQRIRLATQISSRLVDVLYILDEPTIGLHPKDSEQLLIALKRLRDLGNSIIVIEHDKNIMLNADYLVDLGPGAGVRGGEIVMEGSVEKLKTMNTITANYLTGKKKIMVPIKRREVNEGYITLVGADLNNLKNITVDFPLGKFICVTGISGSGKSTLVTETLYPAVISSLIKDKNYKEVQQVNIGCTKLIDRIILIDQSPIGRTPRSNPATYVGFFTEIRKLLSQVPQSKVRGYTASRFSFNVQGGRCENCQGAGIINVEMNFLPDVHVQCKSCRGQRYNRETLEIRYKNKGINEILDLDVEHGVDFFRNIPAIFRKLNVLQKIGLGYIKLGQSSTTLSGGEAQRIKLASELCRINTGKSIYILDEPTTGLHIEDVRMLLQILNELTDKGNTVIVTEHNLDVIKLADHIIDLGPGAGKEGGDIVFSGTPEDLADSKKGFTSKYLREELNS